MSPNHRAYSEIRSEIGAIKAGWFLKSETPLLKGVAGGGGEWDERVSVLAALGNDEIMLRRGEQRAI